MKFHHLESQPIPRQTQHKYKKSVVALLITTRFCLCIMSEYSVRQAEIWLCRYNFKIQHEASLRFTYKNLVQLSYKIYCPFAFTQCSVCCYEACLQDFNAKMEKYKT